jgi:hypothetical protein
MLMLNKEKICLNVDIKIYEQIENIRDLINNSRMKIEEMEKN